MDRESALGLRARARDRQGEPIGRAPHQSEAMVAQVAQDLLIVPARRAEARGELARREKVVKARRMRIVHVAQVTLEARLIIALENNSEHERLRIALARLIWGVPNWYRSRLGQGWEHVSWQAHHSGGRSRRERRFGARVPYWRRLFGLVTAEAGRLPLAGSRHPLRQCSGPAAGRNSPIELRNRPSASGTVTRIPTLPACRWRIGAGCPPPGARKTGVQKKSVQGYDLTAA